MATHTQIIEFFGLPACGKSTLCDDLISEQGDDKLIFCRMNAISAEYRKTNLLRRIFLFPYKSSFYLILLILKSGFKKDNLRIYKSFFSILIIYAFTKHVKKYNYMLIDHGVIQSVISLFYGARSGVFDSSFNIANCLVKAADVDILVYCDLPVQESISRIRKRNRLDSGRLDAIRDEEKLKMELITQHKQFVMFGRLSADRSINSSQAINELKQNVYKILEEKIDEYEV